MLSRDTTREKSWPSSERACRSPRRENDECVEIIQLNPAVCESYLQHFDPARCAVFHRDVKAMSQGVVDQQTLEQVVFKQAHPLLLHHLLQLRVEVPIELEATEQG